MPVKTEVVGGVVAVGAELVASAVVIDILPWLR